MCESASQFHLGSKACWMSALSLLLGIELFTLFFMQKIKRRRKKVERNGKSSVLSWHIASPVSIPAGENLKTTGSIIVILFDGFSEACLILICLRFI